MMKRYCFRCTAITGDLTGFYPRQVQLAEGVDTTKILIDWFAQAGVERPIARAVDAIAAEAANPRAEL